MSTATNKGQITIPTEVRTALKLKAGDRVDFVQTAPNRYELMAANMNVTALKGMLGPAKKAVAVEAMNLAVVIGRASTN